MYYFDIDAEKIQIYVLIIFLKDKLCYSLRPILLFANTDVYRHILVVDTSILAKNDMDRSK
jgi:hypothetical protein